MKAEAGKANSFVILYIYDGRIIGRHSRYNQRTDCCFGQHISGKDHGYKENFVSCHILYSTVQDGAWIQQQKWLKHLKEISMKTQTGST
jgi:hypothetical protein